MKHLETLTGNGRLYSDDQDFGSVSYRLHVWQEPSGLRSSTGALTAKGSALMRAIEAPQVTLELEDGGTVTVMLERTTVNQASVRISGPVPGVG